MRTTAQQRGISGAEPVSGNFRGGQGAGIGLMLASSSSNMVGAAIGATAFPVIGSTGVVAVRQWIAAVTLLVVGRPRVGRSPGRSGGRCCCSRRPSR